MKMFSILVALGLVSVSSFAAQYKCKGVDRADKDHKVEVEVEVLSATAKKAVFVNQDGDEHELDRKLRSNENRYANAVFEDDTYDGYGGFLKLSVPKSVIKKESTASFVVYYLQHVYSEAGHVGTVDIRAVCR